MTLTYDKRIARLDEFLREDRLIRYGWTGRDADGRETACLLAALAPETGEAQSPSACPASIMPEWLASFVPWINDRGTGTAWPAMVRRFADLAGRWSVITPVQWDRLRYAATRIMLEESHRCYDHNKFQGVATAVHAIIELFRRAEGGDNPRLSEWADASTEAREKASAAEVAKLKKPKRIPLIGRLPMDVAINAATWASWAPTPTLTIEELAQRTIFLAAQAGLKKRNQQLYGRDEPAAQESADRITTTLFDAIEAQIAVATK